MSLKRLYKIDYNSPKLLKFENFFWRAKKCFLTTQKSFFFEKGLQGRDTRFLPIRQRFLPKMDQKSTAPNQHEMGENCFREKSILRLRLRHWFEERLKNFKGKALKSLLAANPRYWVQFRTQISLLRLEKCVGSVRWSKFCRIWAGANLLEDCYRTIFIFYGRTITIQNYKQIYPTLISCLLQWPKLCAQLCSMSKPHLERRTYYGTQNSHKLLAKWRRLRNKTVVERGKG